MSENLPDFQASEPTKIQEKSPNPDKIVKGILLAIVAFFCFAAMSACAKILSDTYHTAEIVFWRSVIFLPCLIGFVIYKKEAHFFKTQKPFALFFRATGGAVSMIITYQAFKYLPLADTTVLLFTSTLMIPIMAFLFLGEHVGIRRWVAIILGMVGVFLIATPTGFANPIGVCWALCAAFAHACLYVTLRYLKTENPILVTFYFVLAGVIIPGIFMVFIGVWPQNLFDVMLFTLIAFAGGTAQISLTYAHKYAPASVVAPFNYTGLIWATGFDILIWNYIPGWPVFVGGSIIIASKIYYIWREHKNAIKAHETFSQGRA